MRASSTSDARAASDERATLLRTLAAAADESVNPVPTHPATAARLVDVERAEATLDVAAMATEIADRAERGIDAAHPRVDGLRAHGEAPAACVFPRHRGQGGNPRDQHLAVLVLELDAAAGAHAAALLEST